MENTMASSNVDDKLKKDTENKETGNKETNKILTFIKQNVRYITAGVLFLAMVLILVKVGSPKQPQNGQNVAATEVLQRHQMTQNRSLRWMHMKM